MVRSRRTFTREFKVEAVRMVEEGERPVKEVSEQLGIHPQLNTGLNYTRSILRKSRQYTKNWV
jgi:transposase-like protein